MNGLALVCGSLPAAEDAVQEALARAWERSERGQHIESAEAWVTAVATNLLRDGFRRVLAERRARARLGAGLAEAGEGGVGSAAGRLDLTRALAALPRRQREVAVFRYYLDLDVAEIARVLGIPEGTAKSALHRARRSLAAALGETDGEDAEEVTDVAR
ncbi:MAG: sigma-70 family RNA polymerase sigma factor [Actinobacteria bacterium]|nr:sigma-70 family RNA polymerase sigma factor [Actinomycetota bacterium]